MERKDAITWFEIPAKDLARATRFYETVLGAELKQEQMGPQKMALFPYHAPGVGGCITAGDGNQPSAHGNLVYLQAGASLKTALGRVERAGGRISLGETALPDGMGFFAHIIDTEGNRVGLHALA
jgi:predicted enzyme related to lactoylglutathione lyase